jgi:hypothetical protein
MSWSAFRSEGNYGKGKLQKIRFKNKYKGTYSWSSLIVMIVMPNALACCDFSTGTDDDPQRIIYCSI